MEDDFDYSGLQKTKKRKNSRTKGNAFERKVCKILNDQFQTTDFNRSPGSGAFANTHKLPDYLKVYGDLITPNNFKFIIECKKGYNKESIGSLFNPKSEINNFIQQAKRDASKIQKNWMVLFQQDRERIIAILESDLSLSCENMISYKNLVLIPFDDLVKITSKDFWFNL